MKKALILAYDFPPYVSVGGLRPYNWCKYLSGFGVYPIIATRQWTNKHGNKLDYISPGESNEVIVEQSESATILRAPYFPSLANKMMLKHGESKYRIVRKMITAFYEFAQFPFLIGAKTTIYHSARKYLLNNKVDVIVATGDPFVLFKYASLLSKEFDVPWIADYRDPWSSKITYGFGLLRFFNAHYEKKIVKSASAVITVNDYFKALISDLAKGKEIFIIPNGFNPDVIESVRDNKQRSDMLSIAFVGSIYAWHPLDSFLECLAKFIQNNSSAKLKLSFYGVNLYSDSISPDLKEYIQNNFKNLDGCFEVHDKMQNDELLKEISDQNLFLLFNDYSIIGTKIFDYVGLKRSIVFCYSSDSNSLKLKKMHFPYNEVKGVSLNPQEQLINETRSGYVVKDKDHLYETLEKLYEEFTRNGSIQCNTMNVDKYSRKHQTERLAEIIKKTSSN